MIFNQKQPAQHMLSQGILHSQSCWAKTLWEVHFNKGEFSGEMMISLYNVNLQSDTKDHLITTSGRSIEDSTSGLIDSLIDVHCALAVNVTNKWGLPNSLLIAMASEKEIHEEL